MWRYNYYILSDLDRSLAQWNCVGNIQLPVRHIYFSDMQEAETMNKVELTDFFAHYSNCKNIASNVLLLFFGKKNTYNLNTQ